MDEATEALLSSWDEEALGASVAVVGMSGRFPGAPDLDVFWHNLINGVESVTFFTREELLESGIPPEAIDDPAFVPARAVIENGHCFDATFFQMSPREAELTDPQHRLFLECAWSSLEDAACDPKRFDGAIGVFAGCSANTYLFNNLLSDRGLLESMGGLQAILSTDKDHLATRTSYKLGLTGPSITLQTACSTSLVAVQTAYWSLLTYQCDMALAGGVSLNVPIIGGHRHQSGDIFSSDGHCRAFDAQASGTLSGDGVGIVVLRRLEDAIADGDPIRAVIRGAAINNDGRQKVGYTAPSIQGQAEAIIGAHAIADVPLETITYVETHGTATALGDPVEIAALTQAYREQTDATGFCAIGSVKTNIGHLNCAAGVAGLIKTVLALEHKQIPPSLHYEQPNPNINFADTPFVVNHTAKAWPNGEAPRRAGVSSFGAGGTNAHVVVEEAPKKPSTPTESTVDGSHAFVLSAKTPEALDQATQRLHKYLSSHQTLRAADVAKTLQDGRQTMPYRRVVLAPSTELAAQWLAPSQKDLWLDGHAHQGERKITFLYPAQGVQQFNMGRDLYDRDVTYRAAFDRCCAIAQTYLDRDLRALLFHEHTGEDAEEAAKILEDQRYAGATLFCLGYALTEWWEAQGVRPDAVFGHSTGEYIAACVAGIMSPEDAIGLLQQRAALIDEYPPGMGILVPMSAEELAPLLVEDTYIALLNAPEAIVATGTYEGIDALRAKIEEKGLRTKRVRLSCAAHSPMMAGGSEALEAAARRIDLKPPTIPFMSGVTGEWITAEEATDPTYWVRHMVNPVQCAQGMKTLDRDNGDHVLLELGPAQSIGALLVYNLPHRNFVQSLPHPKKEPFPAGAGELPWRNVARMWAEGVLDFSDTNMASKGERISLPTYPFATDTYWITPGASATPAMAHIGMGRNGKQVSSAPSTINPGQTLKRHPRRLTTPYIAPETPAEKALAELCEEIFGIAPIGVEDNFFSLGADSLITLRLIREIQQRFNMTLPAAAAFSELTIARMAPYIEQVDVADRPTKAAEPHRISCMIPIQPSGTLPPLFLMHPAAGVIFPYFPLVRALGPEQPVYLIQAHGLDGVDTHDKHVEQMAERYIPLIKEIQPSGPYYIGGYSFGCYISFEMARRLRELGDEVAFCGLVDEVAPLKGYRPNAIHLARLVFGRAGKSFLHHLHDYLYLKDESDSRSQGRMGRGLINRLRQIDKTGGVRAMLQRSAMAALLHQQAQSLAIEQPAMIPMLELFIEHCVESFRYTPPPYDGPATLFKSDWWYERRWLDPVSRDPSLGWRHLVQNKLEIRRASGDHLGILRQPHVEILAREMKESMAIARQRYANRHKNTI